MIHTYTQIHIQTVFAVQNRLSLINKRWRGDLYAFMTGIVQSHGHKLLSIGGVGDHVHMFFGFRPNESLSNLMMEVKRDSAKWINKNRLVMGRFSWQEGFGAFSYSKSQIPVVCHYIENQEIHHHKKTFLEEYTEFLEKFGVEYDKRFLFHPI
ncbi:MAG: IS200/IS605 family transposase [Bacteroidales bacterium]|nr:IS200/IS605 family transposase [Bacteroidales bacterium]